MMSIQQEEGDLEHEPAAAGQQVEDPTLQQQLELLNQLPKTQQRRINPLIDPCCNTTAVR